MENAVNYLKTIVALFGGTLGWLFGGFDSLIYALMAFVVLDYITGVLLAFYTKKISSEIGFKGICKKVIIFILVALGNIIDQYIIGTGSSLRTMLIMFYLANEGISIIENVGLMGLPIPQQLKEAIQKLSKTDENK